MKKLMVLAASAAIAAAASAVGEEVTPERFPDADAVTVDEIERVSYNPDGTYEQTDECWTKILTEKGRRDESSVTLRYSRRYGEAAITYVGAIGVDGEEREIDVSSTTRESTDNSSMAANIYDPLDRKIVCSIPGLKIGETVHVKLRRKAIKPRCRGKWADIAVMEWSHPILKSSYEVTAPAACPLRKIAVRHPLGNIVSNVVDKADGSRVYTFAVTNSAQVFPEPNMPPLYTQVQHVRVSTAADWPEISRWYWDLCAPHIAKTNAAMAAKVREIAGAGNAAAFDDALRAVFKFVSQEVRYMGLTMEDTSPGYAPHDVDITFENRYGVCRDKAGLLVAMLRMAGFKAFPVLIHAGAKLDPEVPQPFFNHAIVAVDRGDRDYILMDPTNENTKDLFPSYLCNNSFLVARPDGDVLRTSPVPPSEHNSLDIASSAELARDGSMFFESGISFKGINDTAYRGVLVKRSTEERVKTFERLIKNAIPGAELVKCEISPKDLRNTDAPLTVKLAARLPEMIIRGATRDELSVPTLSKSLGIANWLLQGGTSLEKRKYPLVLDTTARVTERLKIDLGGALGKSLDLPATAEVSGGYGYKRIFRLSPGSLEMSRSLSVNSVEFSPAEYHDLREDIKRVEAAERLKPVFAADFTRGADVRVRLDASETSLFSDRDWVTTNTVVTEVLTYKGKKNTAEMKFSCHPSWKNIELAGATVSNRDGRVYSVTPKEVNYLDVGWAGSAPRYPAGKIMVVNLPSVEIGSVISCRTIVSVTNSPAPFYAMHFFDSPHPVDRILVRVGDFKREVLHARRLPDETSQPLSVLWRDREIFCRGDWKKEALRLRKASDGLDGVKCPEKFSCVADVRDWMAKYVKITGPALYEVPLERQLTDPAVVLKERYATRLDYIRAMCALLRAIGCKADVVFAADDAKSPRKLRELMKSEKPDIGAFSVALCRVRDGSATTGAKEFFVGTENEYTPVGATACAGCDYFDPASAEFGVVGNSSAEYDVKTEDRCEILVRSNGAVDMTVNQLKFGAPVGTFRKKFSEILPEERSRLHQSLLGGVAQAASAIGELATDVEGYPAKLSFSCYVPDYAAVNGDTISITVPEFDEHLPNLTGNRRETPFAVKATDPSLDEVTVRFPAGYTEIEHLPEPFEFSEPGGGSQWVRSEVSSRVKGGALEVTVKRVSGVKSYAFLGAHYGELLKDWRRISTSRANRTITVRRK
ncbi:MAG: DUF3857 domain-containing protein [Kiritimatiellae bacterium]|nr:DUF3857 domain-containing protein [Kiritimatiellia bacterium]